MYISPISLTKLSELRMVFENKNTMTVNAFYAVCGVMWSIELMVWVYVFRANNKHDYYSMFILSMIISAFLHWVGITTTHTHYPPERAGELINLGVPGFDGIQGAIICIAYLISQRLFKK